MWNAPGTIHCKAFKFEINVLFLINLFLYTI